MIASVPCSICYQPVPLGETSSYRTCSQCDARCCASHCKTLLAGRLICDRCAGLALAEGQSPAAMKLADTPEALAEAMAANPAAFAPPLNGDGTHPSVAVPIKPDTLAFLDTLTVADLRERIERLDAQRRGLVVLLRVAQARERKPKKSRKKVSDEAAG